MKFYNYLNENIGLSGAGFEKMVADCKPFLKELKKADFQFLYSGRKGKYEKFNKKKIRKKRKPTDTPEMLHNLLDKKFKEKFGAKARSAGFFMSNDPDELWGYGQPHYVFPVGKYKFIYSYKVDDLYKYISKVGFEELGIDIIKFASTFSGSNKDGEIDGWTKKDAETYIEEVIDDTIKTYKQSKKIPTDLPRGYEIMLIADEVRLQEWNQNEPLLKEWIDNAI